ncbi:peptidoglycan DD-metalloendopeptidase family protein [Eikenella sp. S3360]|uniref:Peptidoglycan DD-metalloendopeptidase family protein n=1 Tax=Eikenella glucosivorans TaxID=2766967 RepID=A0ABS0NAK5_9NEIS|nr:peptidoglycan DD-metalloendopeptidase family protein [Eikenella glucosivorans]MBH5329346.1 peptidoglycan DD-metalloendopeptidase family protein [Eikenella glucosivorans]
MKIPSACTLLLCTTLLAACAGTGSGDQYYRVQRGDTLYRISRRFNQPVSRLMAWNNLKNPSQLEVGQRLRVGHARNSGANTRSTPAQQVSRAPAERTTAPPSSLQWPVRGEILTQFNGASSKGIDIAGSAGTPVKAAAPGRVSYVGEGIRGYGKLILINHTGGMLTAYAHNSQINVREGQQVSAGQTIGSMGSSGTDRVKLHFEVRVNNRAVNPLDYLPK